MRISEDKKQDLTGLVDRWFADDPGDTSFRELSFVEPHDALRYVCDLLWSRDVVVCQVIKADPLNGLMTSFRLLVRCRWRAPRAG
jgi:hypothetical protein